MTTSDSFAPCPEPAHVQALRTDLAAAQATKEASA